MYNYENDSNYLTCWNGTTFEVQGYPRCNWGFSVNLNERKKRDLTAEFALKMEQVLLTARAKIRNQITHIHLVVGSKYWQEANEATRELEEEERRLTDHACRYRRRGKRHTQIERLEDGQWVNVGHETN